MYELIQTGERSYYIQSPVKVGLYLADEGQVYLIDSGNDKDAGKKIKKILDQNGWTLKGILNTHSNADHVGGNQYLQKQYQCRIFANRIECAMTNYPILEPAFLYGGYPFKELRHKFLLAAESKAFPLEDPEFPEEIQVIPLPGHFFDMVGYRTPDDTIFLADCLCSEDTLEKYQITFLYDVEAYLKTLDQVAEMKAEWFVPAHTEAVRDIRPLAELNRKKVMEVAKRILAICEEPRIFEMILKQVFEEYRLRMNYEQYVLVGSTVKSYLAWLKDMGRLDAAIEENQLVWKRV